MAETDKVNNIIKILHTSFANELLQVNDIILNQLECNEQMIDEIGKYLVESGGKRIRPLLTILSSYLFGYKGENHIKLAASTEFIHAATLLHDDVVDSSMLRRFKPTVNSLWGNQAAILVGDYLFSQAFRLMVSANSMESLRALSDTSAIIAKGEVSQLTNIQGKKFLTREEYFATIEAKTSELFAASCKVGAIIANRPANDAKYIYEYGKNVGLIFQIKDDMLDYFSDAQKIGKNIGDDFFEGKITLPIIEMNEKARGDDKQTIHSYFLDKDNRNEEDLNVITNLLNKYDIKQEINVIIKQHSDQAYHALNHIKDKDSLITNYLEEIIEFASNREN